jgi:PAS domain S-box-containing protein
MSIVLFGDSNIRPEDRACLFEPEVEIKTILNKQELLTEVMDGSAQLLILDKGAGSDPGSLISQVLSVNDTVPIFLFSSDMSDMELYRSRGNVHLFSLKAGDDPLGLRTAVANVLKIDEMECGRKDSETWTKDFLDNAIVLIQSVDPAGRLTYTNRTWREVMGYTAEEACHLNLKDIIDHDCQLKCMNMFKEVMSGRDPGVVEAEFVAKDGRRVFVEGRVNCKFLDDKPSYTRGVFRDITAKKMAEEALLLANKKLNLMNGIIRHDVLNQLLVLSGCLTLSEGLSPSPEIMEYMAKEKMVVSNIHRLISFTKTYQDIGVVAPVWNNICEMIPIMMSAFGSRDIELIVDTPCKDIFADQMFGQVLYNLVDNSIKHGGGVTVIHLSWSEGRSGGSLVYEDNGKGVPYGEKERIFDRGYGSDTGLGLFLAREILSFTNIEMVENGVLGKGARFEIRVPPSYFHSKVRMVPEH